MHLPSLLTTLKLFSDILFGDDIVSDALIDNLFSGPWLNNFII